MSAEDNINDRYWRAQLWVSLWPLWLLLYVPIVLMFIFDLPDYAMVIAVFPILVGAIGFIVAHFGFILDGRAVRQSSHDWNPWWFLYFIASVLSGVVFVAPIYMMRRWQKTGRPNIEDVKRKLSVKGLFVPWH